MRQHPAEKAGSDEEIDAQAQLSLKADTTEDLLRALRRNSPPEDINKALRTWAAAVCGRPAMERATEMLLARRLLQKRGILDAKTLLGMAIREAVEAASAKRPATIVDTTGAARPNPEPWSKAVNGPKLLRRIERIIRRYVVVDEHAYAILTAWVVLTYVFERFDVCPLLFLRSPVRRSGKTTLLDVLFCLVSRALPTSNVTAAGMFRAIDINRPTFLVDELDSLGREKVALRNIINAGHHRAQAWVTRADGRHNVYCPKTLAAIGNLPSTVVDRAFVIEMKRKVRADSVKKMNLTRVLRRTEQVRQRLVRWAEDNGDALSRIRTKVPKEVKNDRARDNARPLLAIAAVAGGEWPERVSEAVIALSSMAEQEIEGDVAEVLLKDLARIYRRTKAERIETKVLLRRLAKREASPWPTYSHGRSIAPEQLASLLRPFGVRSEKWGSKGRHPRTFHRGYNLTDLRDAFVRYAGWNPPHSPQDK